MSALRRNLMLGTAGHVDHGKTALVKLLTGCETDTMAEEKARGLTIDLGFAPCRLADQRVVGVVDVPGHVDFIRNMVAGAHGIDVVILVVAADDGIMPQTHEHLHILTLMGLRHGLVALTKIDLVEASRRDEVIQDVRRLPAGTFLADAPICPLSNVTGEGFDGFFDALNDVVARCESRPVAGCFRVWVEDVFPIRGSGTVITGIPTSGRVQADDRLFLLPAGSVGRVRRMQVYGEDAAEGRAGECVALNIPELDHRAVHRGMVLCETDALAPVTMAEAELRILTALPGKVEDYAEVQLHVGTASVAAHLAMLEFTQMTAGQQQMVQLRLAQPLPLVPGDRFVIRANVADPVRGGLTTLGGGRILGVSNVRLRRQKPWTIAALRARREAIDDPLRWCELRVREAGAPVHPRDLRLEKPLRAEETAAWLEQLRTDGRLLQTATGAWLHRDVRERAATALLAELRAFHSAQPERAGATREVLREWLKLDTDLFDSATSWLLQEPLIQSSGELLAVAGWQARVPDRDQQLSDQVEAKLSAAGWAPPSPEELALALGESPPRISIVLRLLADRGVVVRLDERIWMHRDAVGAGQRVALELFRHAPRFSTMEFRDALGVSRKFAVPLVDHLDKVRFTVRSGNHRTPGVEARKLLATSPSATDSQ
jgi:selenocysteine-specific elongation factor